MIKAVIFDYGGVLINVLPDEEYLKMMAKAFEISLVELNKIAFPYFKKFDLGLPEKKFWQQLAKALGRPVPKGANKIFVEPFLQNLIFFKEVFSLVKRLKEEGIKVAVLSTANQTQETLIRQRHGYDDFDLVILSNRIGLRKPDPRIYRLAAKKLGVKCSECIFIDDHKSNLLPAKKLGMVTILSVGPKQVVKEVSDLCFSKSGY